MTSGRPAPSRTFFGLRTLAEGTQLIEHYDAWLQKYDDVRVTHRVPGDPEFVFTGPDGYPFPRHAEELFKQQFKSLQADLYGS